MTNVHVLGCRIDALTMDQTVERCAESIERGEWVQHVCVNAAKLVCMRHDQRLARIIAECGLVSADGQSVVWASRVLRRPLPERVAGIDLMHRVLALAERKGYGVYVVGARPDVLELAAFRLREQYPVLRLVGYRDGYFQDDESECVVAEIREAAPDILLVAISSPRKEQWLAEYGPSTGVPFAMGVGGAVDIVAGITARAPAWMQRSGLEWFFRFLQEPRRLGGRYLRTNLEFLWLVVAEFLDTRAWTQDEEKASTG
jgi:N-acetylglucosaminyldiphosphoundecaprenol N-acetyl-beta-D-mannosaminyltransferase